MRAVATRERDRQREKGNEKYIAIAMQNTWKYNLLYLEFHILWRFIGFPMPPALPPSFPPHRFTQACENFKRQQQISHTVLWAPSLSEAFGYAFEYFESNLWHWINFKCVCVWVSILYVCAGVYSCVFALRSATIFHILPSLFYTLPFGLRFWPKPSRLLLRIVARDV